MTAGEPIAAGRPCNTWLYAVVPEAAGGPPEPLTGVAGEPVRLVPVGGLGVLAGSVPRDEYDEEALQERLEDLAWLERTVRAHHHVIEATWRAGRALPLRFATLYHDDVRAAEALDGRLPGLREALDRIGDRAEWGVKVYAPTEPAGGSEAGAGPDAGAAARPGTAYLLRRQAQRRQRLRVREEAFAAAAELHTALAARAAQARQRPVQRPAEGAPEAMLLNGAYLLDGERAGEFRAAATAAARAAALRIELTGPWPPYSFADTDPAPGPDGG